LIEEFGRLHDFEQNTKGSSWFPDISLTAQRFAKQNGGFFFL